MAKENIGRWSKTFALSNVPVHASLLPNGKVLHWGRRTDPKSVDQNNPKRTDNTNLDEHFTKSFLWEPTPWDPNKEPLEFGKDRPTVDEPRGAHGSTVNLFCAGHCLLADGNVIVTGGHYVDGFGVNQACVYDYKKDTWIAQAPMYAGRWYPSALTLPDGRVFCISGSEDVRTIPNSIPQIWSAKVPKSEPWTEVTAPKPDQFMLDLFPRIHLDPKGRIFMAGPKPESWFLEYVDQKGVDIKDATTGTVGAWTKAGTSRTAQFRDYAPSVMYESGKIMYIGGGTDRNGPTNIVEFIDLTKDSLQWTSSDATNMKHARKQFNATLLPDGTVFVTGGTHGNGFNDLGKDNTVRIAELFNPHAPNPEWIEMDEESQERCYHSIALLLPDGRVLSAGGGEYGDCGPDDCLPNAQLFEPPYLFKPNRPTISSFPSEVHYGQEISVTVGAQDSIQKVSWVRLGSVTHCRNMNQSFTFLESVKQDGSKVTMQAPANANISPPGHYMLFVLNKDLVPSVGSIVRISPADVHTLSAKMVYHAEHTPVAPQVQLRLVDHDQNIVDEQDRPHLAVGLTPLCPYGLGPCWGAAHDALQQVSDIEVVRPVPDPEDSLAFVYLRRDILPDIDVWRSEFEKTANKGYVMRGFDITLSGVATKEQSGTGGQLILAGTETRPQLVLAPFKASSQIKWDKTTKALKPITDEEAEAYNLLAKAVQDHAAGLKVQVIGTLQKNGAKDYSLDVRQFEIRS